jgi:serine/threonine protein kinase
LGSSSQATSKKLHTTNLGRGTNGYRAPEILAEVAHCNNKADMFSLGCVLYEITTGEKLFANDFTVRDYAAGYQSLKPWPDCAPGSQLHALGQLASALLEIDPSKRPGALQTARTLKSLFNGTELEPGFIIDEEELPFTIDPSVQHGTTAGPIRYRSKVPHPSDVESIFSSRFLNYIPDFTIPSEIEITRGGEENTDFISRSFQSAGRAAQEEELVKSENILLSAGQVQDSAIEMHMDGVDTLQGLTHRRKFAFNNAVGAKGRRKCANCRLSKIWVRFLRPGADLSAFSMTRPSPA